MSARIKPVIDGCANGISFWRGEGFKNVYRTPFFGVKVCVCVFSLFLSLSLLEFPCKENRFCGISRMTQVSVPVSSFQLVAVAATTEVVLTT